MNHKRTRKFLFMIGVAIAISLPLASVGNAAEPAKQAAPQKTQKAKPAKKDKKASAAKKEKAESAAVASCVADGGKKWSDGKHCMTKCNEQGTLCDMRICKAGNWKPYSSCFGPGSVAPNCPAACD